MFPLREVSKKKENGDKYEQDTHRVVSRRSSKATLRKFEKFLLMFSKTFKDVFKCFLPLKRQIKSKAEEPGEARESQLQLANLKLKAKRGSSSPEKLV